MSERAPVEELTPGAIVRADETLIRIHSFNAVGAMTYTLLDDPHTPHIMRVETQQLIRFTTVAPAPDAYIAHALNTMLIQLTERLPRMRDAQTRARAASDLTLLLAVRDIATAAYHDELEAGDATDPV